MKHNDIENLFNEKLTGLSPDDFPFEESHWDNVESTLNKQGVLMPSKRKWGGILPIMLLFLLLSNGLVSWKYYNAEQEIQTLNATVLQLEKKGEETILSEQKVKSQTSAVPTGEEMPANNAQSTTPTIQIVEKIVEVPIERIVEKIVYVPVSSNANSEISKNRNNQGSFSNDKNTTVSSEDLKNTSITSTTDIAANQPKKSNTSNFKNDNSTSKTDIINHNNDDINILQSENNITNTNKTNIIKENSITEILDDKAILKELESIELVEIDNLLLSSLNSEELTSLFDTTSKERKLTLVDKLRYANDMMEVSNYELGVSSGIDFMYQNTDFSTFSSRFGITNELSISNYIKIGATVDWKETVSELDNITDGNYPDDYFDNFPNAVSSINPNDLLNKIEYRDRAIEFSFFAKYILQPHNRLTPYFGVGIKGEYDYQERFEYSFLDSNSGFEYEDDYYTFNNRQFGFYTLIGLAGLEYNLTPSITARIDGMYNFDYQPHRFNSSQLQWFSGNIGILYKFK